MSKDSEILTDHSGAMFTRGGVVTEVDRLRAEVHALRAALNASDTALEIARYLLEEIQDLTGAEPQEETDSLWEAVDAFLAEPHPAVNRGLASSGS